MSDSLSLCSRCAIFYASTIPPSPRGATRGDFFLGQQPIQMARNHVFSNHALHECATPLFQWEIGVRGKGFLCHYQGIVWKIRLRRLESNILSPLGPCPPPLPDSYQRHADNQSNGFLALAYPAFHCLGGEAPGSLLRAFGVSPALINFHECLLQIRQQMRQVEYAGSISVIKEKCFHKLQSV